MASTAALRLAGLLLPAAAAVAPMHAAADTVPPRVLAASPAFFTENGKPISVTLTGAGMTGVTEVDLAPFVAQRSAVAINDSTVIVTLPADLAPGTYTFRVVRPDAASSLDGAPQVTIQRTPPVVGDAGPPPKPAYSFAPAPNDADTAPDSGFAGATAAGRTGSTRPVAAPAQPAAPLNPFWPVALGALLGGFAYMLWGSAGRLSAARRQDLAAQIVARPVQRLHLGRICLHCGRLHMIWATRRDLWRAGQYCSATCFVAAQEEEQTVAEGDGAAHSRLKQVVVYSELDKALEAAFSDEARSAQDAGLIFAEETRAALEGMRAGAAPAGVDAGDGSLGMSALSA